MSFAVYNPATNRILTWVTDAKGSIPEGWEFRAHSEVPSDATMEEPQSAPLPVPEQVTLAQFLMAVDRAGLLEPIQALIENPALPQRIRRDVYFLIEYSNFIHRSYPMIEQMAPMIGVDTEQIDEVFRLASTL